MFNYQCVALFTSVEMALNRLQTHMVHFCSCKMCVMGQMISVDRKLQIQVLNIPHLWINLKFSALLINVMTQSSPCNESFSSNETAN